MVHMYICMLMLTFYQCSITYLVTRARHLISFLCHFPNDFSSTHLWFSSHISVVVWVTCTLKSVFLIFSMFSIPRRKKKSIISDCTLLASPRGVSGFLNMNVYSFVRSASLITGGDRRQPVPFSSFLSSGPRRLYLRR